MTGKFLSLFLLPLICVSQISNIPDQWKNDKDLKGAAAGFCVMEARTSSVISEFNSHQSLVPASTLKVVTTSAALGLLGKNFRYETKLCYTGNFDRSTGILNGDLVIVGSGDPTLQSEYFNRDSALVTNQWAKILKDKGLKEIRGKIIADASCFERRIPDNWIWSDIGNYFGTTPCGLAFMDNKFRMRFESGEPGKPALVTEIYPQYHNTPLNVQADVIGSGTEDEACVYGDPYSFNKEVSGTIPPRKKNYEVEGSLPDPALLCAEFLCSSLLKAGVVCNTKSVQSTYKGDSLTSRQLLYTHSSPTLDQIVLYTNLKSNNQYCEALLRTLGKGKSSAGIEAVKAYWQKRGIDISEIFMSDGSGLSRANTITCNLQAQLLSKMYRDSSQFFPFYNSLPVAGKSGSMSNIGKNSFIENNLRAKTGYITRVRAYCGYVKTRSGKNLAFSVILNNYNCSAREARLKIEKFLVALGDL